VLTSASVIPAGFHITLARWHANLKKLMGASVKLPTAQQQAAAPNAADTAYEACGTFLDCNYGFRRNLCGEAPGRDRRSARARPPMTARLALIGAALLLATSCNQRIPVGAPGVGAPSALLSRGAHNLAYQPSGVPGVPSAA
jgi:hypothetical protein